MTENRDTAVLEFWRSFVDATGIEGPYVAEAFGSDAETADKLGRLVRDGQKRATTSLLSSYEEDDEPLPAAGDLRVVLCVIRTISLEVRPFGLVDEAFAWVEGEGDRSLAYWRDAHVRFFASWGRPSTMTRWSSWIRSSCSGRRVSDHLRLLGLESRLIQPVRR